MDERTSHCPYIPWGLRDGTESWDRGLQMGLHGMSSHCPYILWGLRDGMDSWDRGLQMGLHGMSSHCPYIPWGLWNETDSWNRGLQMVPCHRTHGSPKFPLDSDTIKGICPNCPSHPSVPKLSVHPLGTEGWDGQLGQRPVIGDSTGCPFTVRTSLRDLGMGWTAGTEGYRWDSIRCPLTVHTSRERTSHGVPSVALCPNCPSHPSVPKGMYGQ